ncbi:HAD-like protein [Glarea lozoyensis ATCC 20868]|uniref:HAD-like protein n=1 Tax=Glarea lozoyensis (strain ATCC 20868 / MF5171) TaxID=1116229 RepID=S3CU26_GLAL2|nr:HAD-like protein [Glarea lozoyensis ATCC 20868]EPE29907.1 HAD-like protein [Glarea lozoyensis ATCC 20868]
MVSHPFSLYIANSSITSTNLGNFPYTLSILPTVLREEWDTPTFLPYRAAFDPEHATSPSTLESHIRALTASDTKLPALKSLQGYLFRRGYATGELACPLFPDVLPALKRWNAAGKKVVIYSSGSVEAQKLLFEHTTEGDLRGWVKGWYDTLNAGAKTEGASYRRIVEECGVEVGGWVFFSDSVKEVRAAKSVGVRAYVVVREGNAGLSVEEKEGQVLVGSFEGVEIS